MLKLTHPYRGQACTCEYGSARPVAGKPASASVFSDRSSDREQEKLVAYVLPVGRRDTEGCFFMQTLKKLLDLLTPHERRRAAMLLGMILGMSFLDTFGVASIIPFMAVLANPEMVETNALLNAAYTRLGFSDPRAFLLALGQLVFVLLVASLAFKAVTTYAQMRFALMREYSISKRLVEGYLHQPFAWFLNRHSADLGKTILSEVGLVTSKGLAPMMTLITQGTLVIALLTLLLIVDPALALTVGGVLGAAYFLIFKVTSGMLSHMGAERIRANRARFTAISEAFGAVKEVKVAGLERVYIQRFSKPAQSFARVQARAQAVGLLPRYAFEAIAFGGMLLVVLYLMADNGNLATTLPMISLYAFAGYRLMPALQQCHAALTQLRFSGPAIEALHQDLMSLPPVGPGSGKPHGTQAPLALKHAITLDKVVYRYPKAVIDALKGISLTVPAKSVTGLVGTTGSGKTTVVDIILGLLEAQEGTLAVDGEPITPHNRIAWQRTIGYVPQWIYLADDSVAANIAFGIDAKHIDQQALERAAKIANLHGFISDTLPEGYATAIGERGVRLSGGQRQRIGIARALYHNPQVLILDEATNALDTLTEQAVMDAVHNLGHEITIILIAHRLSTVKDCDQIFLLDNGELKGQGRFEQLAKENKYFRAMAERT